MAESDDKFTFSELSDTDDIQSPSLADEKKATEQVLPSEPVQKEHSDTKQPPVKSEATNNSKTPDYIVLDKESLKEKLKEKERLGEEMVIPLDEQGRPLSLLAISTSLLKFEYCNLKLAAINAKVRKIIERQDGLSARQIESLIKQLVIVSKGRNKEDEAALVSIAQKLKKIGQNGLSQQFMASLLFRLDALVSNYRVFDYDYLKRLHQDTLKKLKALPLEERREKKATIQICKIIEEIISMNERFL